MSAKDYILENMNKENMILPAEYSKTIELEDIVFMNAAMKFQLNSEYYFYCYIPSRESLYEHYTLQFVGNNIDNILLLVLSCYVEQGVISSKNISLYSGLAKYSNREYLNRAWDLVLEYGIADSSLAKAILCILGEPNREMRDHDKMLNIRKVNEYIGRPAPKSARGVV